MKAAVDGDSICIMKDNFTNLQESEAVFVAVHSEDNIEKIAALLNKLFAENEADRKMAEVATEREHVRELQSLEPGWAETQTLWKKAKV